MSEKLAIEGGKKVFKDKPSWEYAPKWPPVHPETEEKLIKIYRSRQWSLNGEYEQLFSKEFAEYQGAEHCAMMANGTTTLECALLAFGVGPGDEVVVPAITWLATATAVLYIGGTPVIVDVEPDTLCIDPKKIEEAITPRTKAIIPVHLWSSMADMDKIMKIANRHNLFVVEDCAHAHGAKWKGKGSGTLGHVGSFSFQQSKLMACGEGGACITNDKNLADYIFQLSHIGASILNPEKKPESGLLCRNYRFTEFQAAIIYDQLHHLKAENEKRATNGNIMQNVLANTPGIKMQAPGRKATVQSYYMPALLLETEKLKPGITRKEVFEALNAEGVAMGPAWGNPIYKMHKWNISEDKYIKRDTGVAEDACYNRIMACGQTFFLCEPEIIEKAALAINKVMRAYTI